MKLVQFALMTTTAMGVFGQFINVGARRRTDGLICTAILQRCLFTFVCATLLFSAGLANAQTSEKIDFVPMEVDGRAKALQVVEILPRIRGIVASKHFDLGRPVQVGDVLIRIEEEQFKLKVDHRAIELENARFELKTIESEFDRINALVKKKLTTATVLYELKVAREVARGEVEEAEADLKQAEFELSHTIIRSPINGYVSQVNVDVGDFVTPEQALFNPERGPLMTVVNYAPIRVVIGIDQSLDLRLYQDKVTGEDLDFALELPTGQKYSHPGKFNGSYHRVDPNTGKVEFELLFPNPDLLVIPGQTVKIRITKKNPAR